MEKNLSQSLRLFGLDENEIKVYLTMLNTGHSSILKVSKYSEIKRSTVYTIVEKLIEKGLVRISVVEKKKRYLLEDPEKIIKIMEERKSRLEDIVPELKEKYGENNEKPIISFYEGKDGVRQIYKKIFKCKTEMLWYGVAGDMTIEFPEYDDMILKSVRKNPDFVGLRSIVNNTKMGKEYAMARNKLKDVNIKIKLLPSHLYFFNSVNVVFDNKLLIISITKDYFATLIESKTVSDAYRQMFEVAWQSAVYPK